MSLTAADQKRLGKYLRGLADRMRLKDWEIEVLSTPADDSAHAEIRCVEGRKLAKIQFARDWGEQTPEVLRHTCCHELIHCHFAALHADLFRRLKDANLATCEMLLEYGIDAIADAIAPHLPLPLKVTNGPTEPA